MSSSPSRNIDRESMLKDIKPFLANDWNIEEETKDYFTISKNNATFNGHILVFVFFGWWLLFIPNIIYHINSVKKLRIFKKSK